MVPWYAYASDADMNWCMKTEILKESENGNNELDIEKWV